MSEPTAGVTLWNEPYRPQFHFTPERNWINDPNGLVYFRGEWHLFYQYFDPAIDTGMLWGHAVSGDLVHWQHLPVAIVPDKLGKIWSGSAVVDQHDSSGLFNGQPGIVCLFTYFDPADAWQSQGLAYSADGRSFTTYDRNPVIPQLRHIPGQPSDNDFRDPKVFWHAGSGRWVMAVAGGKLRIFSSANLIDWRFESVADDTWTECPDLFELPIDGNASRTQWVLSGGGRWYQLGEFDGKTFTPTSPRHVMDHGPDFYATQTWNDAPGGRRVGISWLFAWNYESKIHDGKIFNAFPTAPWSGGSLTVPTELSLRTTPQGVRLFQSPVVELDQLRQPVLERSSLVPKPGDANPLASVRGKTFDLQLNFTTLGKVAIRFPASDPEYAVEYDGQTRTLSIDRTAAQIQSPENFPKRYEAVLPATASDAVSLRILIDHSSLELFANAGQVTMSAFVLPDPAGDGVDFSVDAGHCTIHTLRIARLRSATPAGQVSTASV